MQSASNEVYTDDLAPATANVAELANIPHRFTRRPQWAVWRYEQKPGKAKVDKVPYTPGTGRRASTTDLLTWRTFKEALAAVQTGRYDGIGFVFCSADPFVAIDLDSCRNPETGEVAPWAQEFIDSVSDKYLEISPSGRGVHIITCGVLRGGRRKGNVEVYGQERFFTFTGVRL